MMPHSFTRRSSLYTVVGAICALANNVVMMLGDWAGANYVPMSIASFILVTPLGYLLNAGLTFRTKPSLRDFARFAAGVALGFPLYFLVMATLCSGLRLSVAMAAPISTISLFAWNYASAHWAICPTWFSHNRLHRSTEPATATRQHLVTSFGVDGAPRRYRHEL